MKKSFVYIILGILALLLIPLIAVGVIRQQDIRSRAAPATTLSITPTSVTKSFGDTFSVEVRIETGTNSVTLAKIDLTFDSTVLEAISITNGALSPRIYSPGTVSPGAASISVGAESELNPISGTGTISIVRFKVIGTTPSPASIQFAGTTFVSGLGEATANVLVGTTPGTVTIGGNQIQGTGTPTQTPTSTPTSTPTPVVTGSGTLTPTPIPTGATGTPTATPSIQSTISITPISTQSEMPQSGTVETTLLLVAGSFLFIIAGFFIAL